MFDDRKRNVSFALLYLSRQVEKINDKARTYGTDTTLHNAEIHMIKMIKEDSGISVTDLAEKLEVTKGAVSQILARLDKKGMIAKDADPKNLSRLSLTLTPKGQTAYENHRALHELFNSRVTQALSSASEEERSFLLSFLNRMTAEAEEFEKKEL